MLNRRKLLAAGITLPAVAASLSPARAQAPGTVERTSMRGSIDATNLGVRPGALDDQSRAFQRMLDQASDRDMPVFLPGGVYVVSNIVLPRHVRLSGVPGATRLVYGGDGYLMAGEDAEHVEFDGLVVDGSNRWLSEQAAGLVDLRRVRHLVIDNCSIGGSGRNGIALERTGGRIERSVVSGAADAGIYAVESTRLSILANTVADCGNGGILVHRWQPGEDGTIVSGNRVERIGARNGGTGQFGNGISLFRAGGAMVQNNQVSDCAFSAVRANGSSNIQVTGNTCRRSGETALYAEFAFDGAVIAQNIVDGAANGISVVNFNEGGRMAAVTGNLVRNLATEGPYPADAPGFGVGITVEADCSVTGNVVENAPLYGMHLGWGAFMRNVVATGNVVRGAREGIAVSVVEGTGTAVISDNVFQDVPGGAVVGHRWSDAVTGDLALLDKSGFDNLLVERNRIG